MSQPSNKEEIQKIGREFEFEVFGNFCEQVSLPKRKRGDFRELINEAISDKLSKLGGVLNYPGTIIGDVLHYHTFMRLKGLKLINRRDELLFLEVTGTPADYYQYTDGVFILKRPERDYTVTLDAYSLRKDYVDFIYERYLNPENSKGDRFITHQDILFQLKIFLRTRYPNEYTLPNRSFNEVRRWENLWYSFDQFLAEKSMQENSHRRPSDHFLITPNHKKARGLKALARAIATSFYQRVYRTDFRPF